MLYKSPCCGMNKRLTCLTSNGHFSSVFTLHRQIYVEKVQDIYQIKLFKALLHISSAQKSLKHSLVNLLQCSIGNDFVRDSMFTEALLSFLNSVSGVCKVGEFADTQHSHLYENFWQKRENPILPMCYLLSPASASYTGHGNLFGLRTSTPG